MTSRHRGGRQVISSFSFHLFIDLFDEASVFGCICTLMRSVVWIPVMKIAHIGICGKRNGLCGGTSDSDYEGTSTRLEIGFDGLGTKF